MARVIPRDQLAAYQRWQANDFNEPSGISPAQRIEPTSPAQPDPFPDVELVDAPISLPTAEDIERIHEQARTEGYQAGYAEGMSVAQDEMALAREAELAHIRTLTANFSTALNDLDQLVAEQALALALEVARQVVRSTLQIRQDLLLPLVREALQSLPLHHGTINIHAHPDDIQTLRDSAGELSQPGGLHFIPDPSITPGGCLIKAGHSDIDASVETRWKRVLEAIGTTPQTWMTP